MLQRLIITLAVVFIAHNSAAVFMIEPSIGYHQETLKFTDLLANEQKIKTNSPVIGLKLGVTSMGGISFDLAGTRSSGKAVYEPALSENPNYTHVIGSAQVGVNAMGILKIYLGYLLHNEFDVQTNTAIQGFKLKGQGYQAGLMTFPFPRLGIGLQYNIHQYKEIAGNNFVLGSDLKNYFTKTDIQDVSLNLSLLF